MMKHILEREFQQGILILDGAMGTLIQRLNLQENNFRGNVFVHHSVSLKDDYDVLNLSQPAIVQRIHQSYIDAGADLITTNTFSSNVYSQQVYGMENHVADLCFHGAHLAREVADKCEKRKVLVVGSMGPTPKSLSQVLGSCRLEDAFEMSEFKAMVTDYCIQAENLIRGGADILLLETCYDVLNTKAALTAIESLNEGRETVIPVMVSVTINNKTGKTFLEQSLDEFYTCVSHYPILSFGINCSCGVDGLEPYLEHLAHTLPCWVSCHPNAGLPNEKGEYADTPEYVAGRMKVLVQKGLVRIVGGCCGTTPSYISTLANILKNHG